tara:strand:+ start:745 stop:1155 length:411 start_codon:yes stop_codon:yes gene_type:complete
MLPTSVCFTIVVSWSDHAAEFEHGAISYHVPYNNYVHPDLINNKNNIKQIENSVKDILTTTFSDASTCIQFMYDNSIEPFRTNRIDRPYTLETVSVITSHCYTKQEDIVKHIQTYKDFNVSFELIKDDNGGFSYRM